MTLNAQLMADVRGIIGHHPSRHDQESYVDVAGSGYSVTFLDRGEATAAELAALALTDRPGVPRAPERPICQTTACVAGWAAILSAPAAARLTGSLVLLPGGGSRHIEDFAQGALGLSAEQ